jgi:hypothetical protein
VRPVKPGIVQQQHQGKADDKPPPTILGEIVVDERVSRIFHTQNTKADEGENKYRTHRVAEFEPHFFYFRRLPLYDTVPPSFEKNNPKNKVSYACY